MTIKRSAKLVSGTLGTDWLRLKVVVARGEVAEAQIILNDAKANLEVLEGALRQDATPKR